MKFAEADYLRFDPCHDADAHITQRSVHIVKARKPHACYLATGPQGDGHTIAAGDTYRSERAMVNGAWGVYRVCIPCMEMWLVDAKALPIAP